MVTPPPDTGIKPGVALASSGETKRPESEISASSVPAPEVPESQPPGTSGDDAAPWPGDDAAEAVFRADALSRGENVGGSFPVPEVAEAAEEPEPKGALPPLDQLVQRLPAEVRDTLEDLFRAKFVSVKRVPKKALKK